MKTIPTSGIAGEKSIREAATTEYKTIISLVTAALHAALDEYAPMRAIYADRAVVEMQDGRLISYAYTINDDNKVVLGEHREVIAGYTPAMRESAGGGAIIEALSVADGKVGTRYLVRIIRAGLSGNRNYYPDATLREAAPKFAGARVFVKSDDEHRRGQGKDFGRLIGRIIEPVFVAGPGADSGELRGTLELLESATPIPQKIHEAWQRRMAHDLFGFSIDALGAMKRTVRGGQTVREAVEITHVNSLDLVIEPAAGGELLQLLEAQNAQTNLKENEELNMKLHERMVETIKQAHAGQLPDGLDTDDDVALEAAYREAVTDTAPGDKAKAAEESEAVTPDELERKLRMVEARAAARMEINASALPQQAKQRLQKDFDARNEFDINELREAIKREQDYVRSLASGGQVTGLGDEALIEAGEDRSDKVSKMLDGLFDPANRDIRSLKECYVDVTGDKRVTGRLDDCDKSRLAEATGNVLRESLDSTSWGKVLGDAITRRMVADYAQGSNYDVWRRLCSVVPVNDFRSQERTRMGGYGDLPKVAQSAAYGALDSPTDEQAKYSVEKRGGTEDVTLEMIKNDDVGAVMRIPTRLSRAAKRTLSKFVLDFLADNSDIYDNKALFHNDRGNLGTTALNAAALAAARLAVLQQTELNSGDRIGIAPINLWVPFALEETAFDLFRRQTNNDTDFVESLQMSVLPVWYWTDNDNWYVSCDPMDVPAIEVGFLDGAEEPELFVQDNPTVGSMFSHDKITYKIRHIYGGNVLDYRGLYGAVVA